MKVSDPVSPELREIERQLDDAYKANPLLQAYRGTAVWTVLSVFEDRSIAPTVRGDAPNVQAATLRQNLLINGLRHPLVWLQECPAEGKLEPEFNEQKYKHAYALLTLADAYDTVSTIFTYASRDGCHLELDGKQITPVPLVDAQDARYYAYNRFIVVRQEDAPPSPQVIGNFEMIARNVRVVGNRLRVSVTPRLVEQTIEAYRPSIEQRFQLPGEWRTTRYQFDEFKAVFTALYGVAAIQFQARAAAVMKGIVHLGFEDAVLIQDFASLRRRLHRYSQVDEESVRLILEDLTYGSRGIGRPDPALQPLIPIGNDRLAIAPSLILAVSPERNLCVLLNSIPDERRAYSALVDQKESLMRDQISASPGCARYRPITGRIPQRSDLGNIDLALIDDTEMVVLLLELKWFIGPDEVVEVLNRNEDLLVGVKQVKTLLAAFSVHCNELLEKLKVTAEYRCFGAVVSQNWIGQQSVQDEMVPIVNTEHLIGKANRTERMSDIVRWLTEKHYLPVEGVHFTTVKGNVTLAGYDATWYDIKPLINHVYDPAAA